MTDTEQSGSSGRTAGDDADSPQKLEALFNELAAEADGSSITLGEILDALEKRSFGPLLLLPTLVSIMPVIGMLPGVTWAMSGLTLRTPRPGRMRPRVRRVRTPTAEPPTASQ